MSNPEILAVHEKKLEEFLKELELWEPLVNGQLKCLGCGVTISMNNIGMIVPSGKEIQICCNNADCVFKMKELKSELAK